MRLPVMLRCVLRDLGERPAFAVPGVGAFHARGRSPARLYRFGMLAALAVLPVASVAAQRGPAGQAADRRQIRGVLARVADAERGKDVGAIRDAAWPGATFGVRRSDEPASRGTRRAWAGWRFSGPGVLPEVRYAAPRIRLAGTRARIGSEGRGIYPCLDRDDVSVSDGSTFVERNDIVMERRARVWRVVRWDRVVQPGRPTRAGACR